MADKRTIAYWSILLVVVLVAGLVICVAPTQSRYVHTAVWNTIVLPGEQTIKSDYLQNSSEVAMTVLLGDMPLESGASTQVKFQMESEKGITGGLTWRVDNPEYLQAAVCVGTTQLQQGGIVALAEKEPVTVTMDLTITELAIAMPHEEMRVNVEVSWGGVLKGTFAVDLPEVAGHEGENPVELPEPAQPEELQTEESQTEPTTAEETTVISSQSVVQIKSIRSFTKEIKLPVTAMADNKTDKMVLGVSGEDGSIAGFPKETCYSLDQGQSYYMLYNSDVIDLPVLESQIVLLDFTRVNLQGSVLDLQMNAYREGELHKTAQTSVAISEEQLYQLENRIMKDKETLQVRLNTQWADYSVAYSMEKVTVVTTELGNYTQYMEIDPAIAGFVITVTEDPDGDLITVVGGEQRPAAGNYVLHIQWSDGDMVFGQTRIPFFVNYYTEPQSQTEPVTEPTGGAEL